MKNIAEQLKDNLVFEARRRLMEEGQTRIKKCLAQVTESEIWFRPNDQTVSIGNQVLHLCGNVRQWILAGLAGQPDIRERDTEFDINNRCSKAELVAKLDQLMEDVDDFLETVTVEQLLQKRPVQAYNDSGMSILIHVIEHFSYHVGQITYIVKSTKNVNVGYYKDVDLTQTN